MITDELEVVLHHNIIYLRLQVGQSRSFEPPRCKNLKISNIFTKIAPLRTRMQHNWVGMIVLQ